MIYNLISFSFVISDRLRPSLKSGPHYVEGVNVCVRVCMRVYPPRLVLYACKRCEGLIQSYHTLYELLFFIHMDN